MSKALTIFLVSAADNLAALTELQGDLLARGHTVQGRALHARTMQERRDSGGMLLGEEDQLFERLAMEVAMADLFVLVAPDDHDTACLAGMAHVSGVPVALVDGAYPSLPSCFMLKGCVSFWCDMGSILEIVDEWPDLNEEE